MVESFNEITAFQETIYSKYPPEKFVGREWLIESVNNFLEGRKSYLIIVGESGKGKSAFISYIAEKFNFPRFFVRSENREGNIGRDPKNFIIRIGHQLFQKYGKEIFEDQLKLNTKIGIGVSSKSKVIGQIIDELYTIPFLPRIESNISIAAGIVNKSEIIGQRIKKVIPNPEVLSEANLFQVMILNPVSKLKELYPNEKVFLLIDAIDEIYFESQSSLLDVLPSDGDELPDNLKICLTTRSIPLTKFQKSEIIDLDHSEHSLLNLEDASKYIKKQLSQEQFSSAIKNFKASETLAFEKKLLENSEGNLLFLYLFLEECLEKIKKKSFDPSNIFIPKKLDDLFDFFLREKIKNRAEKRGDDFRKLYLPLLGILSVIQQPVSKYYLEQFTKIDINDIEDFLEQIRQFLHVRIGERENYYEFYHPAFNEYLLDSSRNRNYTIRENKYHQKIIFYYLNGGKKIPWDKIQDRYSLNHLSTHLLKSENWEIAEKSFTNTFYLEKKLKSAGGILAIKTDFDHLLNLGELNKESKSFIEEFVKVFTFQQAVFLLPDIDVFAQFFPKIKYLADNGNISANEWINDQQKKYKELERVWLKQRNQDSKINDLDVFQFGGAKDSISSKGHTGIITVLRIFPDGRYALSGDTDGAVIIWDISTGLEEFHLQEANYSIQTCSISNDGSKVAIGDVSGKLTIWEFENGIRKLSTIQEERDPPEIFSCAFSSDNKYIAYGTGDGFVKIVELSDLSIIKEFQAFTPRVSGWISPPADEGREEIKIRYGYFPVTEIAFYEKDFLLTYFQHKKSCYLINISNGLKIKQFFPGRGISSVCFVPNQSKILAGSLDGSLILLENTDEKPFTIKDAQIIKCDFRAKGNQGLSISNSNKLSIVDFSLNEIIFEKENFPITITKGCLTNSKNEFIFCGVDSIIRLGKIKFTDNSLIQNHRSRISFSAINSATDEKIAITYDDENTLIWWSLEKEKNLGYFNCNSHNIEEVTACNISPVSSQTILGDINGNLWIFENPGEKPSNIFSLTGKVISACYSPNGRYILAGSELGIVCVWDLVSKKEKLTFKIANPLLKSCAFSKNSEVITTLDDKEISFWHISTGKSLIVYNLKSSYNWSLNSDGSLVVVNLKDGISITTTLLLTELAFIKAESIHASRYKIIGKNKGILISWGKSIQLRSICTKKLIAQYVFETYISSLSASEEYIVVGLVDGQVLMFDIKNINLEQLVRVNKNLKIHNALKNVSNIRKTRIYLNYKLKILSFTREGNLDNWNSKIVQLWNKFILDMLDSGNDSLELKSTWFNLSFKEKRMITNGFSYSLVDFLFSIFIN